MRLVDLRINQIKEADFSAEDFIRLVPEGPVSFSDEIRQKIMDILSEDEKIGVIYADESIGDGAYLALKPDYSPDTLWGQYYIGTAVWVRGDILNKTGINTSLGFIDMLYDLVLKAAELPWKIKHAAEVVPSLVAATGDVVPFSADENGNIRASAIERRGLEASLETESRSGQKRIVYYEPVGKVSVIIPSKDHYGILRQCIDSLVKITEYKNYEIIVVDNGSIDANRSQIQEYLLSVPNTKYICKKMDFNFSAMCNIGAQNAAGEYLLFLNDDTQIIDGKWMTRMLGQAMQPHAGAVGAKLLYPGGELIQHIGVIELASGPSHALMIRPESVVHTEARNLLDFNYSAVTAACLMISKEKYDKAGGFDENLPVTYNDVDFCYKLVEAGLYNCVRTDAVLWHHESLSRGQDTLDDEKFVRLNRELGRLHLRHPEFGQADPFYNPRLITWDVTMEPEKEPDALRLLAKKPKFAKTTSIGTIDEVGFGHFLDIRGTSAVLNPKILLEGLDGTWLEAESVSAKDGRFECHLDRSLIKIDRTSFRLYLYDGERAQDTGRVTLVRQDKKSEKLLCKCEPWEDDTAAKKGGIVANIDEISENDGIVTIRGFAFPKRVKHPEHWKTELVLKSKDGAYICSTNVQDRMDVQWAYKRRKGIYECGFVCNLMKGELDLGATKGQIIMTNRFTGDRRYYAWKK